MISRLSAGLFLLGLATGAAVAQTPSIDKGGVVSAAVDAAGGNVAGPVTAGSLISIYGNQLAVAIALAQSVPLSTQLNGTSVTFNGIPAALNFVAGTQINAQVPWTISNGTANVVVTRNGLSSAPEPVVINQVSPAVYSTGGRALAFIVTDPNDAARYYAYAAPATPGLRTSAARAGDVLQIYATGLGPVDSTVANGAASLDKLRNTVTKPTVLFNGAVPGQVLFSGLAPEFPGVYQLNVQVPPLLPVNPATRIQVQINGLTSPANGGTIAIQ